MWVSSGISKRRKCEEKRRNGRDKFTDRKEMRTVAVCWDAERHFSVEFYKRFKVASSVPLLFSRSLFSSVFFLIDRVSFLSLFFSIFLFLLLFFSPFKFYYSHFIQLIDCFFFII